MTTFNIRDSDVEQLNSTGDNIKVVNKAGTVSLAAGNSVQATGQNNKAISSSGKSPSLMSLVVNAYLLIKRWLIGPVG